jgi:hypothetical protein
MECETCNGSGIQKVESDVVDCDYTTLRQNAHGFNGKNLKVNLAELYAIKM